MADWIKIEGTYTRNTGSDKGLQELRVELDDSGVPQSVISGEVLGVDEIDTGYKLYASDGFCIEETLDGIVVAFTSDGAVFEDGVLLDECHTLPAEGTPLILGATALDGRAVGRRDNTKVWTYVPEQYEIPAPCFGYPLEDLDDWTLVHNQTVHQRSRCGYFDYGRSVKCNVWTTDLGVMNLSKFEGHSAKLSGTIDTLPAGETWCMPFSKMKDANNIVGVRQNGANIEINTRVSGSWNTIASVANSETGLWEVLINDTQCRVYINGSLKLEAEHTLDGDAYFGISDHKVEDEFTISHYEIVEAPDWWHLDSLDNTEILGAWDFAWDGHNDAESAKTDMVQNKIFTTRTGSPSINGDRGYVFGGAGSAKVNLGELDWNNVSIVVQFSNYRENSTLDALFSHYIDTRFCLQQDLNAGQHKVRWSCGDDTATTFEIIGEIYAEGTFGVSGPGLYINGEYRGEEPETGPAVQNTDFILGGLDIGSSITQYSKVDVQKLLIVNRKLTTAEQRSIYERMNGNFKDTMTDDAGAVMVDDAGDTLVLEYK